MKSLHSNLLILLVIASISLSFNNLRPVNDKQTILISEANPSVLDASRRSDDFSTASSNLRRTLPNFDDDSISSNISPEVLSSDLIYNKRRNTVPIVNEEYKVVFFQVAKVATTEFFHFFRRLANDDKWCSLIQTEVHKKDIPGLAYLSDYTPSEATNIMTSSEWKKIIFVRHPKQRLLSAFLDKAVQNSDNFAQKYCASYERLGGDYDQCVERHEHFDFFLHNITTTLKDNVHWRSIYSRNDEKWWPYVSDNVGYMSNLNEDAKAFLSSIYSSVDNISAWDRVGKSGWSLTYGDCDSVDLDKEPTPFLGKHSEDHTTDANEKLLNYYTPELEKFVEEQYADDLHNPYFHFSPLTLFPDYDFDDYDDDDEADIKETER
mmetsp:Transcript_4243/g.5508  ORF Transcript_4243/g.5508 Transcript_4243/m.5508 type:complete len:378 (-) Transcript_4243:158-1291(-)